jgi:hypothetical protein
LFERKVSARKFSKFAVTPFRSNNLEVVSESAALTENTSLLEQSLSGSSQPL